MARGRDQCRLGIVSALLALGLGACDRQVADRGSAVPRPAPDRSPGHIVVLPDSAISAQRGSTEDKLAAFLASGDLPPRTFRFDGTQFVPWASEPNPATLRTMYVMTQILRAYPHAQVTLVGYTDNDGTAEQNLLLARQRVARLATILQHGGVRADRIRTEGRGATDFIADNGTEAGRARNRRIELIVTAK